MPILILIILSLILTNCINHLQPPRNPDLLNITVNKLSNWDNKDDGYFKDIINKRFTYNIFRPWNGHIYGTSNYGLIWDGSLENFHTSSFHLRETYWAYHYPGKSWSKYQDIEKF